jgi:hypothetical protein
LRADIERLGTVSAPLAYAALDAGRDKPDTYMEVYENVADDGFQSVCARPRAELERHVERFVCA